MRPILPSRQVVRLGVAILAVLLTFGVASLGTPERPRPAYHHYVALGDSYTAAPFVPFTDVAYGCLRSNNNYPHLVARALHIDDLRDRSCTGARTADLTGWQTTSKGMRVPPQLGALSPRTDLVTVGIGANNGRLYAKLATVCRRSQQVCRLYDQRTLLRTIVGRLGPALVASLEAIRARAPNARILLISYPKLLPQVGDCARLPRMRPQDRRIFREINLRLRNQMYAAAAEAGVEFVDFYRASLDHNVCARHPWIQGRQGSSRHGAALHPLPAGQAALARILEDVLASPPPGRFPR